MQNDRKRQILKILDQREMVSVKELVELLQVSDMTVRRDLNELSQRGLVERTHGGVRRLMIQNPDSSVILSRDYPDTHNPIVELAKGLLQEKDTIGLGAGALINSLAAGIVDYSLTVVTTSMNVALSMSQGPSVIYLSGGRVEPRHHYLYGDVAERGYENFFVDKLFITSAGLNQDGVISELEDREARIKRMMIKRANHVYLLLESQKFDVTKFYSVTEIHNIEHIITDQDPGPQYQKLCQENGVQLLYPS